MKNNKILVVGASCSGKTSIIGKLKEGNFKNNYSPTLNH